MRGSVGHAGGARWGALSCPCGPVGGILLCTAKAESRGRPRGSRRAFTHQAGRHLHLDFSRRHELQAWKRPPVMKGKGSLPSPPPPLPPAPPSSPRSAPGVGDPPRRPDTRRSRTLDASPSLSSAMAPQPSNDPVEMCTSGGDRDRGSHCARGAVPKSSGGPARAHMMAQQRTSARERTLRQGRTEWSVGPRFRPPAARNYRSAATPAAPRPATPCMNDLKDRPTETAACGACCCPPGAGWKLQARGSFFCGRRGS